MTDCIFCKIINKEIPAKPVFENDHLVVINDIAPKAPIHLLIIPKRHFADFRELTEHDAELAANLLLVTQKLAAERGNMPFRLQVNNGSEVGQKVFHSHMHMLGGREFAEF